MPDEAFAISPSAPPPPTEADYEAIHAAVMETVRGRWFLSEYAKRNRHADTSMILAAIDRVEALWRERGAVPAASPAERVHFDLVEMAKAIAQTRSEIAAIKPDGDAKGSLSEASEELGSIVHETEKATSDILAAAEQVQEIAWTLREHGADAAACDALDQRATEIYSACSFQDLTGQRTRKVVEVLRFLEERIRAMIEIWGNAGPAPAEAAAAPHLGRDAAEQLAQPEIDRIMPAPAAPAAAAAIAAETQVEAQVEAQVGAPIEAHAELGAEIGAESQNAPGDRMADAVAAHGVEVGSEAPIAEPVPAAAAIHDSAAVAAENSTTAELVIAPMAVGATALAFDPSPVAATPAPEPPPPVELTYEAVVAPAPQSKPETQPQAGPAAELQAEPSAAAEPADDDDRSDPAVMLKRILALIRTPNGASLEVNVADPPDGGSGDVRELVMTLAVAGALAADDTAAPASSAVAASTLAEPSAVVAPAVAAPVTETPVVATPVVEVPVAETAAVAAPIAQATVAEAAPVRASAPDEAVDEILLPLSGPLTVDQAVSDLLGNNLVRASALTAEPAAPAAVAHAESPFTLAVPELTIAPAPVAPASPQPAPREPAPAAVAAAFLAPESPPEPIRAEALPPADDPPAIELAAQQKPPAPIAAVAPPELVRAEAPPPEPVHAEPLPPADNPPAIEPAARQTPPAPIAAISPPAAALAAPAAEMPAPAPEADAPVVTATFRQPSQPIPPSLRPLLAAIAALSDDEKLALFS